LVKKVVVKLYIGDTDR